MATIGTIDGYGAVFDSPSDPLSDGRGGEFIEEIDPHAFDAALRSGGDVLCLFNHDPANLLGRTSNGTARVSADQRGLHYSCDLPNTGLGRDVRELVNRRDITGSSFGFFCKRDNWSINPDGTLIRRILEIDQLLDVSPVTVPAYPQTAVHAA